MEFRFGGLRSRFHIEIERASLAEGRAWNGKEKLGMGSKTFIGKLFARNGAFCEMERQCADRVIKILVHFK
ncbi:hypothetical protein FHG64_12670 [Antarcticibacterium flavum]|uniref:Uncharacterized protein n=1 Tax=Antarcticibacterium flavum TaxID=2058175 RepID=A0A5B7X613_9FLAO|nr:MULTISPECIES: hypothetical protein [Antarcticibacterium]MCM4158431.1 hypothetical protein [Antarcticibacterium sp. W02-3]QCY70188.1 hypothetical protein FHG64_12670 [Antarcticibacterium flavum]